MNFIGNTSNYSTILVDSATNQLRYLAPIHQFQNWGVDKDPYRPLSNIISQVNSCNVMTIKNLYVGIGTTNPTTQLYVVQGASNAITIDGNNATTGITIVANSTQCNVGVSLIHDRNSNAFLLNKSGNIYIRNGYSNQGIFIDRTNNVTVGGNVNTSNLFSVIGGGLSVGYSNADKAALHSVIVAGSVSIGTLSSAYKLNVNGSTLITSILSTSSNVGINTTALQNSLTVAGGLVVGAYSHITGPAMGAIISGNVGIGTFATTNNTLNVAGSLAIGSYGNTNTTAPNNGLIISGNVGIGTTFNGNALSIAGTTVIGSYARNASIITNADSLIVSGNIGIGSTNPQYTLDVKGAAVIGNTQGNLTAAANGLSVYGNLAVGSTLTGIQNLLTIGGNASIGYANSVAPNNGLIILGNTGIGHPSGNNPANSLDINGSVAIGASYYGISAPTNSLIVSGNVGVGTTTPRAKLHIIGTSLIGIGDTTTTSNMAIGETLNVSGLSTLNRTIIQNTIVNTILTPTLNVTQNTGSIGSIADFFDSSSATAATPVLRVGAGGNVAIGGAIGSSGAFSLNVNGPINSSIMNKSISRTSNTAIFGYQSAYPTPSANGVLIRGNTGIGHASGNTPGNLLSVNGSVGIGSAYYGTGAPADSLIVSGNIGINTDNPTSRLHVVGPANIGFGNTTTVNNLVVTGNINVTGLTTIANTTVTQTETFTVNNVSINTPTTPALKVSQNTGNSGSIADFIDITGNLTSTIPVLRVDCGGKVGIGTNGTANAYSLTVNGQTITNTLLNTDSVKIGYTVAATVAPPTNGLLVNSKVGIGSTNAPANPLGIYGSMTVGVGYYAQTGVPADSLIISGNLGVGITNPSSRLHIVGAANIGVGSTTTVNDLLITGIGSSTNRFDTKLLTASNLTILNTVANTLTTPGLKITQNTNGVGSVADFFDSFTSTTIPLLRVKNNKTVVIGDGDGTNSYNLIVNGTISAAGGVSTSSAVSGTIAANNITSGILDSARLPNIGTAGTYGTVLTAATAAASFPIITTDQYGRVSGVTTQAITSSQWIGPGASTPLIYFNGIVGIGTTGDNATTFNTAPGSSASCYLYVDGDIYASGDVIALSDEKYKKDLEVIEDPIKKIKEVSGYTYTRTDTGQRQTGVLAQELEKILPEAVQTDAKGDKSVAYGNVIGLLIECIKDQQKQIDELRALIK